jgi:excisionase family DNA binding protein
MADLPLLTTSEVADALRVSVATVNRYARCGDLPAIVLPGGQRRYRAEDVDKLLAPTEPLEAATASP